jgi:hypothetical protein
MIQTKEILLEGSKSMRAKEVAGAKKMGLANAGSDWSMAAPPGQKVASPFIFRKTPLPSSLSLFSFVCLLQVLSIGRLLAVRVANGTLLDARGLFNAMMSAISCLTSIDPPAHRACEITTGRPWMSFLPSEPQCLLLPPLATPFEESVLAVHVRPSRQ